MERPPAFTRKILFIFLLRRGPRETQEHAVRRIRLRYRNLVVLFLFVCGLPAVNPVCAQQKERNLDEVKAEAIKRAENGMYPLIGLDPADVREAFASIQTSSDDAWAAGFSAAADKYMNEGKSLQTS